MSDEIRNLVLQLRAWSEPIASGYEVPAAARTLHAAADALEAMAGEVQRLKEERDAARDDEELMSKAKQLCEAERDRTRADYEAMKAHNKELFGKLSAAELERDRLAGEVEQACGREQRALLQRDCATKEAEAWREERDRLKAALEPFAKLSTDRERQDPPEGTMRVRVVTAPEIEAARKALGGDA